MGEDSQDPRVVTAARRAVLAGVYPQFETFNLELKASISEWQLSRIAAGAVASDSLRVGDGPFLERLRRVVARARQWLTGLASTDETFANYCERLDRAMRRVDHGEFEFVAGPRADSIHTIWWSLHAELLRLLGRARGANDT